MTSIFGHPGDSTEVYFVAAECFFELRRRLSRLARASRDECGF